MLSNCAMKTLTCASAASGQAVPSDAKQARQSSVNLSEDMFQSLWIVSGRKEIGATEDDASIAPRVLAELSALREVLRICLELLAPCQTPELHLCLAGPMTETATALAHFCFAKV